LYQDTLQDFGEKINLFEPFLPVKTFQERVSEFSDKAKTTLQKAKTLAALEEFNASFLGKKSELNVLLKELKELSPEEKKTAGPAIQSIRTELQTEYEAKKQNIETKALNEKLVSDWIDVTKQKFAGSGSQHPISRVQRQIEGIFTSMGFEIADGPEVETEWHNFDALNIPTDHPARDMQDTFWIQKNSDNPHENTVLRTQTSNVQIRTMMEHGAPVRLIAPGRVFRSEDVDMTHDATFSQVEGLVVDKNISLSHLKGTIQTMLSELFEKDVKIRFRPGYFPFVEPGLEVDMWFEFTDKSGEKKAIWLEFMGAGMVHPNVLKNCGIDSDQYSGFAFGFGLTRLAMMRYGIDDIRLLFSQKKDFLTQF
jgi:phenylalanyl-tRNA synthetase alpha chain